MDETVRWVKEHPGMTGILALYALFFLILYSDPATGDALLVNPETMFQEPWTLITVIFATGSVMHLLLNGFLVIMFGGKLEKTIGTGTSVVLFLIMGLMGSVALFLYAPFMTWTGEPAALASVAAIGMASIYTGLVKDAEIMGSKARRWVLIMFIMNIVLSWQNEELTLLGPAHGLAIALGYGIGYGLRKSTEAKEHTGS
ncbi:rhomboid family intramembrane serine protease [Salisediminibacterium selenitireducens]|uniref:Rhomboid family protein n=1 Tax=Bacillus selenitireducens (strain ATCC 700615 / DSM 15326 / MLS10) TaxID=439292 RepID=D6XVX1_BACIE|nr:rhomboid family intramembrane serine protease [Salisediminibacterium selenitireducens]ADH97744.1 Rhomboid family protein [[Bacillus] selenitireducens MLS10]